MRTILSALLLVFSAGCGDGFASLWGSDPDEPRYDEEEQDGDPVVGLSPDHVVLGPDEFEEIDVTIPDGFVITSVGTTLDDVRANLYGESTLRLTNEGSENAVGHFEVRLEGPSFTMFTTGRVQTWDGNGASSFNSLELTVERGRFDNEQAELVAYRDAVGYHAAVPFVEGVYEIPLDVSLPYTDISIVCEGPVFLGTAVEHLVFAVPTDDDFSMVVDCRTLEVEMHAVSGALLNVPPGSSAQLYSFDQFTSGSAAYSLDVPANGDSEIVSWISTTNLPEAFLYTPLGPSSTIVNLDFAASTPATLHSVSVTGNSSLSASVTMRTGLYTTLPVSVFGTSLQFASTSAVTNHVYGLEARNTDSNAYSAYAEIGSASSIGDVILPDPDLAGFPAVSAGPTVTFMDGGDRHFVELSTTSGFDQTTVRFFTDLGDVTGFSYPDLLSGLQTLTGWDAAWELGATGDHKVERIDSTTCFRWMSAVSRPDAQTTCAVERMGWTGTF